MPRIRRAALVLCLSVATVSMSAPAAHAAWSTTTLDDYGDSNGESTSMVLGPAGGTFVAFTQGGDDVFWAKKTATGWKTVQVRGMDTFVGCFEENPEEVGPDVGFDANGAPIIVSACQAVGGGAQIFVTRRIDRRWKTQFVGYGPTEPSMDSTASSLSLAMTASGKPHIVLTDLGTLDIVRFQRVDGRWRRQTLLDASRPCCGGPQRKLLDAQFDPLTGALAVAWVTYVGPYGNSLEFAEYTSRGRLVGDVETVFLGGAEGNAYTRPSLAFLPNGDPVMAFQTGTDTEKSLAIARRSGEGWSVVPVDASAADVGANPSLFLVADVPHIAYADETNDDLRYATATTSEWTSWTTQTIASDGDLGELPSLVVAANGSVRVTHYDRGDTALRYTAGMP